MEMLMNKLALVFCMIMRGGDIDEQKKRSQNGLLQTSARQLKSAERRDAHVNIGLDLMIRRKGILILTDVDGYCQMYKNVI